MDKYYAVKNGREIGIFLNWPDCHKQVDGFKDAVYKSFKTREEATNYLNDIKTESKNVNIKPIKTSKGKTIKYKNGAYKPFKEYYDIIVYTDGGSINYVGGYGFVVLTMKEDLTVHKKYEEFGHIEGRCTNQAAELHAIYNGLNYVKDFKDKKILIRSDSENSIKSVTQYIITWKKNGYLTARKEPILNKDLIVNISNLLDTLSVTFEHIISHEGEFYNEMADQLADKGVNHL